MFRVCHRKLMNSNLLDLQFLARRPTNMTILETYHAGALSVIWIDIYALKVKSCDGSMSDSSNGAGAVVVGSSSTSMEQHPNQTFRTRNRNRGSVLTVKATLYRGHYTFQV